MGFLGPIVQFPPPQSGGLRRKITISPMTPPLDPIAFGLGEGKSDASTMSNWEIVARPKRKGLTDWTGQDPYRLGVPILIDGFVEDRSVEPEIEYLRRLERVPYDTVDGDRHPAVCRVAGPLPLVGLQWVIEQVEWGDEIRRASDGVRVRQAAIVHFLEFVNAQLLVEESAAKRAQRNAPGDVTAIPGIGQIVGVIGIG